MAIQLISLQRKKAARAAKKGAILGVSDLFGNDLSFYPTNLVGYNAELLVSKW